MSKINEWQHLKIPYKDIEVATENFRTLIGRGGYGWVYKGKLLVSGKETMVAVKRLNEQFGQGLKEFLTEIQLLSGQRHPNLITLLGYCDEGKEKTIVYEYADRGSLDQYIRRSGKTTSTNLTWLQRLKICADAARGLDHLHNHVGRHRVIIHRDIKSSNILIDENWVGMISDLGLSKLSVSGFGMSAIVSNGCGTQGYCEPEYYSTGVVTKKSDVFSFGVVLFEVLCGRLCLTDCDDGFSLSSISAKKYYENNSLDMIIDHSLKEHIGSNSMTKFAAIAYRCLHNDRDQRPAMDVVTKELEEALRLLDIDDRTALPVAACQDFCDVANLLLEGGAEVDSKDRWGSTGPFTIASWHGTKVAVKKLEYELFNDNDEVRAFRDELELLQKIRHPNVVQFLGAVTQSNPMMIVTEYLPKGDFRLFLKRKGALKPVAALEFAMDIARGMNYLHENKPEPIILRDLEPSNILRADSGHLKVANFGICELLKVNKTVKQGTNMSNHDTTSGRYVAPEVLRYEDYDTKVNVFSFALILQEMIEGNQPFFMKNEDDVPKAYVANERPPFNAPSESYAHGLRELIEECWHEKPDLRPTFREIITILESIYNSISRSRRWKVRPLKWFQKVEIIWKKEDSLRSSHDRSSHV